MESMVMLMAISHCHDFGSCSISCHLSVTLFFFSNDTFDYINSLSEVQDRKDYKINIVGRVS